VDSNSEEVIPKEYGQRLNEPEAGSILCVLHPEGQIDGWLYPEVCVAPEAAPATAKASAKAKPKASAKAKAQSKKKPAPQPIKAATILRKRLRKKTKAAQLIEAGADWGSSEEDKEDALPKKITKKITKKRTREEAIAENVIRRRQHFVQSAVAAGIEPQIDASGATIIQIGSNFRQLVTSAGKLTDAGRDYEAEGLPLETGGLQKKEEKREMKREMKREELAEESSQKRARRRGRCFEADKQPPGLRLAEAVGDGESVLVKQEGFKPGDLVTASGLVNREDLNGHGFQVMEIDALGACALVVELPCSTNHEGYWLKIDNLEALEFRDSMRFFKGMVSIGDADYAIRGKKNGRYSIMCVVTRKQGFVTRNLGSATCKPNSNPVELWHLLLNVMRALKHAFDSHRVLPTKDTFWAERNLRTHPTKFLPPRLAFERSCYCGLCVRCGLPEERFAGLHVALE
jgi:hypothetical protein